MNESKEKVVKELAKWICKELKNTSSMQTESILVPMIEAFAKLTETEEISCR